MHIFYTPDLSGQTFTLNEDESKHCIRVLRLKNGDTVNLTDGRGGFFNAILVSENPRACTLEITEANHNFEQRNYRLHMAVAPTKNTDRLEWFLEKAVEIGIDEFTPVICEHSERKNLNIERLERIAISAMKQSIKAYKPIIHECQPLKIFLKNASGDCKLIAHCIPEEEKTDIESNSNWIKRNPISEVYKKSQSAVCLIGPEGDFSPTEVNLAVSQGFAGISLGNSRLRTETAGLVACHSIYFMNQ
jgi:16S rRNA (uracil1498-N3)-methyltransferase